jgi:hypothetical protein
MCLSDRRTWTRNCALHHDAFRAVRSRSPRASIQRALSQTRGLDMHLYVFAIIAALLLTVVVMALGLMTMAGGGETNDDLSTPLMWARVGAQALTILLLVIAVLAR